MVQRGGLDSNRLFLCNGPRNRFLRDHCPQPTTAALRLSHHFARGVRGGWAGVA